MKDNIARDRSCSVTLQDTLHACALADVGLLASKPALPATVARKIRAFAQRHETALKVAQLATIAVIAVIVAYFGFAVPGGTAAAVFPMIASKRKSKRTERNATPMLVPRSNNDKTGDVPTVWVGKNRREAWESCNGCALRDSRVCYAWTGTPGAAQNSIEQAHKRGKSYGIERIDERSEDANMIRIGALGDPARANKRQLERIIRIARLEGLDVVGYTHFWREESAQWLRSHIMASCNTEKEAIEARAMGWSVAVVMPAGTTGTIKIGEEEAVECPAIAAGRMGKTYTCNQCSKTKRGALCDASKTKKLVYFPDHATGATARASRFLQVIQ